MDLSTSGAIVTALGGPTRVGRLIGLSTTGVSEMKRRGRIPVTYWPVLIFAAARLNPRVPLSSETLMRAFQPTSSRQRHAQARR